MVANPDRTNASIVDVNSVISLLWLTIHALSIQMVFARAGTVRRGRKILMGKQSLGIVLGHDAQGGDIAFDLATLPHLLIGGFPGRIAFKVALEEDRVGSLTRTAPTA